MRLSRIAPEACRLCPHLHGERQLARARFASTDMAIAVAHMPFSTARPEHARRNVHLWLKRAIMWFMDPCRTGFGLTRNGRRMGAAFRGFNNLKKGKDR
jgi:hypothetical protein